MRHGHEDIGRAVDASVVRAALLAVDVRRRERPGVSVTAFRYISGVAPGTRLISVWKLRYPESGRFLDRLRIQVRADIRLRRLKKSGARLDADLLGKPAQFHVGVDPSHVVDRDGDSLLRVGSEAARRNRQVIPSGRF